MILISVIITTYNSSLTLSNTLQSIFNQKGLGDVFDFEVLLMDDCSTDTTLEIAKKFDTKIFINDKNSGGPNRGRNLALEKAKGEYICFIDHDDVWYPNKTLLQLKAIKNYTICTTGYTDLDLTNQTQRKIFNKSINSNLITYNNNETFLKLLSKDKNRQICYFAGIMIHASLKNIRFEEIFGKADYDWLLRLFQNQKSIEICDCLFERKVDGKNLSLNENYRLNDYQISHNIIQNFKSQYDKESLIGEKRLNASMARYYYLIGASEKCRKYLLKSELTFKNVMYYCTSFVGRKYIVKYFKVFG
ncbi:MAG: glycosyltransferase family 2 protein [Cytophagales bacterium]